MKESWKDIPGYDGKYQADTEGNIRRVYSSGKTRLLRPYHKHMSGSQRMIVKLTGDGKSRRQPVAKIDCNGEVVEVYSSAREAARKNYMSYQTIIDRCNRKCKSTFAPDGYAYAWDDKEISMRYALRKN